MDPGVLVTVRKAETALDDAGVLIFVSASLENRELKIDAKGTQKDVTTNHVKELAGWFKDRFFRLELGLK
jgi:hypothetical protein